MTFPVFHVGRYSGEGPRVLTSLPFHTRCFLTADRKVEKTYLKNYCQRRPQSCHIVKNQPSNGKYDDVTAKVEGLFPSKTAEMKKIGTKTSSL